MTLGTIIELISFRLGDRTGLEDKIIAEVELVQGTFEKGGDDLPWFLETRGVALTVPAGQSVALPTGFLRPISVFAGTTEYCKATREDLKLSASSGRKLYAISNATLYLPDGDSDAVDLTIDYYAAATVLADQADTNGWSLNAPNMLIGRAGGNVARTLRDTEALQLLNSEFTIAKAELAKEIVSREESGAERSMSKYA